MISSGGAVTGPVGATVETGTKRKRAQVGLGEFREPLGAEQREAQGRRGRDRAEQQPRRAALEAQHDVGGVVRRARGCSGRWCTSTSRTSPPNSIMWSIECTPTAVMRAARRLVRLRAPVVGGDELAGRGGVRRHHRHHLAELAVGEPLSDLDHGRMKAPVEADRQHDAGALRRGDRGLGARPVERQRLLDMDVLAGDRRGHHLLGVLAVRRRQHHGVDVAARQRILEAVEHRDVLLAAEVLGARPRPRIGRGEFDRVGLAVHGVDQRAAPASQPDDGGADGHASACFRNDRQQHDTARTLPPKMQRVLAAEDLPAGGPADGCA